MTLVATISTRKSMYTRAPPGPTARFSRLVYAGIYLNTVVSFVSTIGSFLCVGRYGFYVSDICLFGKPPMIPMWSQTWKQITCFPARSIDIQEIWIYITANSMGRLMGRLPPMKLAVGIQTNLHIASSLPRGVVGANSKSAVFRKNQRSIVGSISPLFFTNPPRIPIPPMRRSWGNAI